MSVTNENESYRYTDDNRRELVPESGTTGTDRIRCLAHRQDIFRMFHQGSDISSRMNTEKK